MKNSVVRFSSFFCIIVMLAGVCQAHTGEALRETGRGTAKPRLNTCELSGAELWSLDLEKEKPTPLSTHPPLVQLRR